jgi:hypothetical protein
MKTCVSGLNALFRRTKDVKHPFYSIWPKIIYVTVTKHFANLVHVKIWKLAFRAWMHYFGVPMFRSIHSTPLDPKWYMGVFFLRNIYGSVTEVFANLLHVKRWKLVFPAWMHYIGAPKLRSILSTPLYPKWCLGVFQSISMYEDAKLVFRALMHYFGALKREASILLHLSQNYIRECYGALH